MAFLRGPVTLAPIAEPLAVELSLCVYDLGLLRLGFEHTTFRFQGKCSYPLRHRRGSIKKEDSMLRVSTRVLLILNWFITPPPTHTHTYRDLTY